MFIKLNSAPIPIDYVEHEHDESLDFQPSFWFENKRHMLGEYVRTHNNPWCQMGVPEFIHGVQMDGSMRSFTDPLYIELIGDSEVNVYHEERSDNNGIRMELE